MSVSHPPPPATHSLLWVVSGLRGKGPGFSELESGMSPV